MPGLKTSAFWDVPFRDAEQKAWARDGVMWQSEAPLNPSPRPSLLSTEPQKTKNATQVAFFRVSKTRSLDLGFGAQIFLELGQFLLLQLLGNLTLNLLKLG